MQGRKIDRVLFFAAVITVLLVSIPLGLMQERAEPYVSSLYNWISSNLGVFYQWFGIGTIAYLAWLTLSRYGSIRLGGDKPDFASMIADPKLGRTSPEQVTFYRNVGNQGLQFSSVGGAVYKICKERGLGMEIPTDWFLQDIRD